MPAELDRDQGQRLQQGFCATKRHPLGRGPDAKKRVLTEDGVAAPVRISSQERNRMQLASMFLSHAVVGFSKRISRGILFFENRFGFVSRSVKCNRFVNDRP